MDVVDQLAARYKQLGCSLSGLPATPELSSFFFREIRFSCQDKTFIVPVFDEYEDVEKENSLVLFHLVVQACEYIEESKDYANWAFDTGIKQTDKTKQIYDHLITITPHIRTLIGSNTKAVSDYDMSLNTGIMQKLRQTQRKSY